MHRAAIHTARPNSGARGKDQLIAMWRWVSRLCAFALALMICNTAAFASTAAGTVVANTATLSFEVNGVRRTVSSNTVSFIVAELLDVSVDPDDPTDLPEEGECGVGFIVTNLGNGTETFGLTAIETGVAGERLPIARDRNDDNVYQAGSDPLLPDGQLTLAARARARVFAIIKDCGNARRVRMFLRIRSGDDEPGTIIPGGGDGGGDAVVGNSGGQVSTPETVRPLAAESKLVKSQSVTAPDGGSQAIKGAIVTYRLDASFTAAVSDVEIDDPIPAGTSYVPGSLTVDGSGRDDAGHFDGAVIRVALGNVTPGTRSIRFQVRIE